MLGIVCNTTSFIVGSITIWNEEKRWLKFSVIVRLFRRNCSATSFLKEDSISFLKD